MDLITLADVPELRGSDPAPRATIPVARLDNKLRDPRYGKFAITQDDVDGWTRNLSEVFGGRVSIDEDHSSDRGKGTKAAAWIEGLSQRGKLVEASVQFTPEGARKVREQEYLYISPTFVDNYVDEHGQAHGKALLGAALTNRPVLRKDMPTLSLSRDEIDGVARLPRKGERKAKRAGKARRNDARAKMLALLHEEDVSHLDVFAGFGKKQASSDSRGRMDLPELAKLLDLPEDAEGTTVLAKVAELAAGAPPVQPAPPKSGKLPAGVAKGGKKGKKKKGKGKVTMALSAEETAQLITAANAGQAAALQLSEQRFDTAWDKALSEGRAAPSQEDIMRALWRENQELAVKTLDSFVRIVPTKPAGSGEQGAARGPVPDGVDADRFELHQQAMERAKTLARENEHMDPQEAYALAAIEIEEKRANEAAGVF